MSCIIGMAGEVSTLPTELLLHSLPLSLARHQLHTLINIFVLISFPSFATPAFLVLNSLESDTVV